MHRNKYFPLLIHFLLLLEPPCGLNLILHQQLYPEEHAWPAKGTRASTGDALVAAGIRLGRYERALRNSLKTADGSILVSSQGKLILLGFNYI